MSAGSPARDLVGAVLNGRWRLVRLLGEGGMGAVFEAEGPPGTGRRAIKLLHQEYVREELILSRFVTEFQATRGLVHPNVAQVFETATAENGTPYLVMELLQGTPVATYVDQGQALPPPQAVHIAHGMLQALGAAHARSIIHRDIKPDNLFLVHDNNGSFLVKVLDFGIAKVMDVAGGMGQKTRTGVLLGTPGYMSPEQIKDSKSVDGRADLWSVGIIFYELLTGTSPFPADNEFARLTSVLTDEIRPIEQAAPHLASWSGFFQRALAKDPAWRFQTADEMAAALHATARAPSMRPPPTLQEPQDGAKPVHAFAMGETPKPPPQASAKLTTPMAAVLENSGIGVAPASLPTRPASGVLPPAHEAVAPRQSHPPTPQAIPGLQPAQASLMSPSLPVPSQSGLMPAPLSYAPQPPLPPHRPGLPSTPPPPLASYPIAEPVGVSPTAVSAQHPGPAPMHPYAPSIDVVDAPPRIQKGAAWWVVGVVAFVSFGLGLALGLAIRFV